MLYDVAYWIIYNVIVKTHQYIRQFNELQASIKTTKQIPY